MGWQHIAQDFLNEQGLNGDAFKMTREVFSEWQDGGTLGGHIDGRECEVYVECGECVDFWIQGEDDCEDDSWSDGDSLASAGHGTDEDYGYYGEDDGYEGDW